MSVGRTLNHWKSNLGSKLCYFMRNPCWFDYSLTKRICILIGNETFEKIGIIGTLSNLLVYLTQVFNLKKYTAATIINAFSGTINFGTFFAAFLCDTYFGRYKTLSVAVIACFLVLMQLILMGFFSYAKTLNADHFSSV